MTPKPDQPPLKAPLLLKQYHAAPEQELSPSNVYRGPLSKTTGDTEAPPTPTPLNQLSPNSRIASKERNTSAPEAGEQEHDENGNPVPGGSSASSSSRSTKRRTSETIPDHPGVVRQLIINFSIPILIRLGATNVLIILQTAFLGHCGVLYLGASALGDIITNTAGILLQSRVSRNFMTLSYGAGKYDEVGLWLYTALFSLAVVAVPVMAVFWSTQWTLEHVFGVDPSLAALGGYYQSRMSLALPAVILFLEFANFFAAQGETQPGVTAVIVAIVTHVCLGLQFIFGIPFGDTFAWATTTAPAAAASADVVDATAPTRGGKFFDAATAENTNTNSASAPVAGSSFGVTISQQKLEDGTTYFTHSVPIGGFGFYAVPVVWYVMNWTVAIFLISYYCGWKMWHVKCLSRISPFDPRIKTNMAEYFKRYLPSQAAMASDILRLSLISGVVATIGTTEVAVYKSTLAVSLCASSCTYALATGSTRYLAVALGSGSATVSRTVFRQGFLLELAFVLLKGGLIYVFCPSIAAVFSTDPMFLERFNIIRTALSVQTPLQCLALFCEENLVTLHKNRILFVASLTSSWVPVVWYCATHSTYISDSYSALPLVYFAQAAAYLLYLSFYVILFGCFLNWDDEIKDMRARLLEQSHD
eukprot:g831.t1